MKPGELNRRVSKLAALLRRSAELAQASRRELERIRQKLESTAEPVAGELGASQRRLGSTPSPSPPREGEVNPRGDLIA